ncbi:unnamed protein product, partial [Bubo scandiacus]
MCMWWLSLEEILQSSDQASKLGQVAVRLSSQALNISTDGDGMVSTFSCCSVCLLSFAITLYSPED